MENKRNHINRLYIRFTADKRVNVWHISLYHAILHLWETGGQQNKVRISRKTLMALAHFNSIVTYHKCIGQLQEMGYIIYRPNYDCYAGSWIEIK